MIQNFVTPQKNKTMNRKYTVIFFLLICSFVNAQGTNQLNEMINECMEFTLDWHSNKTSNTNKNNRSRSPYICLDNLPSNFVFSDDILKRNVRFMSLNNISGRHELRKKEKHTFLFTSIELDDNLIRIIISAKKVSRIRKRLNIGISDWIVFTYAYSCDENEWQLKEKRIGGI